MKTYKYKAKTLPELAEECNKIDLSGTDAFLFAPFPKFGGIKPESPELPFSWDETHILICSGLEWGKQWKLKKRV